MIVRTFPLISGSAGAEPCVYVRIMYLFFGFSMIRKLTVQKFRIVWKLWQLASDVISLSWSDGFCWFFGTWNCISYNSAMTIYFRRSAVGIVFWSAVVLPSLYGVQCFRRFRIAGIHKRYLCPVFRLYSCSWSEDNTITWFRYGSAIYALISVFSARFRRFQLSGVYIHGFN